MQKIALIGLGAMGGGMARRILSKKLPLAVYNRHSEVAAPLAKEGARLANSPADAARDADIVISMVADDRASWSVWLSENGALAAMKPGAVVVESSTLSPTWVAELAAAAAARHCHMLDAPVTGSKSHAITGDLLFLVGGDKEVLERVRPVLAVMSRGIIHLGAVGSGALMKLINNFLNGVQAAAFAEAWVLVERLGLDIEKALDVITNGAPGSPIVKSLSVRMANHDYQTNFYLRLMEKDLMYVTDVANQEGFSLRSAQPALELFRLASQNGWGDKDFAAVIEPLREIALSKQTKD